MTKNKQEKGILVCAELKPAKISWPDVQWRVRTEDAEAFGWIKEETVRVVTMPCCGFTFLAEHTDGDDDAYTCPLCEPR